MIRRAILLLACAAAAMPASATHLPAFDEVATTPSERAMLDRLKALAAARVGPGARPTASDVTAMVAKIDALFAEMPKPTRLRAMVQMLRAELLVFAGRDGEAAEAVRESLEGLPGYSAPLYSAAQVTIYLDKPREALDHYLAAAALDPEPLAKLDDYDVHSLVRRLNQHRDEDGLARFAELLARVGWKGAPDTQSALALTRIEARMKAGDAAGAERLIGDVVKPYTFSAFFTDRRLDPLREAALRHGGSRLEKLWPGYLAATRAQWQSRAHERAGRLYADVLAAAGHDSSLIAAFGPIFEGPIDVADHGLLMMAVPVARAYARLGQWQRGYDLLDKVASAFADQDSANRLNVGSARAMLLREEGRLEEAAATMDAVIVEARRYPGSVGAGNLAAIHGHRACILEQLGRSAEASDSWTIIREREPLDQSPLMTALLCRDDLAGAKRVLIAAIEREATRSDALDMVQPPERGPYPSDYSRRLSERRARLRADPDVRAAALRFGHIMTHPLNAGAPPDPLAGD